MATASKKKQATNEQRENAALAELQELGGTITLYEPPKYIAEDELRGIKAQFLSGTCNVIFVCATDALKRKSVSGISAVNALDEARAWFRWQEKLKPEFRFHVALEPVAPVIFHRPAGDTATTAARRAATERRVIALNGTPHLVDSDGSPIAETHA